MPAGTGREDVPGAPFELIAANLQWEFDTGAEEDDPVDAALRAHAERARGPPRCSGPGCTTRPASWVRVMLGYVNRGSIADVESERTALVDVLQRSGAARCCVEVLAATDVTDAHRWLEARCRPLWPAADPVAGRRPPRRRRVPGRAAGDDPEHGDDARRPGGLGERPARRRRPGHRVHRRRPAGGRRRPRRRGRPGRGPRLGARRRSSRSRRPAASTRCTCG